VTIRLPQIQVKIPREKVKVVKKPYSGPSTAEILEEERMRVDPAQRMRDNQSDVVDHDSLVRLFKEANVLVDADMIKTAIRSYLHVSCGRRSIPMNQCDIVLEQIGVKTAYQRMKIFQAFDGDGDNIMDYREFIWGLSLLVDLSLPRRFQVLWGHLAQLTGYSHLDMYGGGKLQEEEIRKVLAKAGHIRDEKFLRACTKDVMTRVGYSESTVDGDGFAWEDFQEAIISDHGMQIIMEASLSGDAEMTRKARVMLSCPVDEIVLERRASKKWGAPALTDTTAPQDTPQVGVTPRDAAESDPEPMDNQ